MFSSTPSITLPKASDTIEVSYLLGDSHVWWPSTVVSITPNVSKKAPSRATGVLTFHAAHGYRKERARAVFLEADSIMLHLGDKTNVDTAWRHQLSTRKRRTSNRSTATTAHPSGGGSRPSKTPRSAKKGTARGRDVSTSSSPPLTPISVSDNDEVHVAGVHNIAPPTPVPSHMMSLLKTVEDEQVLQGDKVTKEMKEVQDALQAIRNRMKLNEDTIQTLSMRAVQSSQCAVSSLLARLKYGVIVEIHKVTKFPQGRNSSSHRGFLASSEVTFDVNCDLDTFSSLAKRMYHSLSPSRTSCAFYPSFNATQTRGQTKRKLYALVLSVLDLFPFLGINDVEDKMVLLFKTSTLDAVPVSRLMGSMQWNCDDEKDGLTIFAGQSSHHTAPDPDVLEVEEVDMNVPSLHWESSTWDSESNYFICPAVHRALQPLYKQLLHTEEDILDCSTFKFSWCPLKSVPSKAFTPNAADTGNHVLGTLTVHIPMLHFKGDRLNADISKYLVRVCNGIQH